MSRLASREQSGVLRTAASSHDLGVSWSRPPLPGQLDLLRPTEHPLPGAPQGVSCPFEAQSFDEDACLPPPHAPPPAEFSKRKAVHLHRPDLGCSDVQEKGEKKEREQDPKHLARKQVRLPEQQRDAAAVLADCGLASKTRLGKLRQPGEQSLLGNVVRSLACALLVPRRREKLNLAPDTQGLPNRLGSRTFGITQPAIPWPLWPPWNLPCPLCPGAQVQTLFRFP